MEKHNHFPKNDKFIPDTGRGFAIIGFFNYIFYDGKRRLVIVIVTLRILNNKNKALGIMEDVETNFTKVERINAYFRWDSWSKNLVGSVTKKCVTSDSNAL